MGILQTAERSSHLDPSENVMYQRHLIAYKEAAKIVSGTVLEVGSGEGYGIMELAPITEKYIAVDKYDTHISDELKGENDITFIQTEVPPLKGIDDDSVDFVVTFQVIEHIQNDELFLKEIKRVLKPGGILILETPNPENIIVGSSSFYLDPSHKAPVHPETLSFLTKYLGFELVKIVRLNEPKELIQHNSFELRRLLYGVSPDYSIIAQKKYDSNNFNLEINAFNINYGFKLEDIIAHVEKSIKDKELDKELLIENQFLALQNQFESLSIFWKPFSATTKKISSFVFNKIKSFFK